MAAKKDLLVYQGDDHSWPMRIRHADLSDPANPIYTPFDLTGYNLVSHIRLDYADLDETVDAALTFTMVDAAQGTFTMHLSSEDAATLSGKYRWDLQVVRIADDYVTTLLYGAVKVQSEVTRP